MDAEAPRGLLRYFDEMTDPRHHNVQHLLSDMLAIAILAAICGAESWTDVAMFGRAKKKWLATFLRLPRGIPSHDTFGRLFARLDPREFEQCIVNWTAELATCTDHQLIAVDGKTIRRSFDRADEKAAIHMINAWCDTNRLVLGQLATEDKSNEITAMPKLLALLNIQGATVTLDAMHCQKKTVQTIVRGGGDYVIAVKGNQGHLCEQLKITLDEAILLKFDGMPHDHVQTVDADHGRVEDHGQDSRHDKQPGRHRPGPAHPAPPRRSDAGPLFRAHRVDGMVRPTEKRRWPFPKPSAPRRNRSPCRR